MTPLDELFEASSPLALRLAAEPVLNPSQLIARAWAILPGLSEAEKVATLNAHPRIGESPGGMSARSRAEQGSGQGPAELARLNREYERKFGFRFVVFVNGRSKGEILEVLRTRLRRSRPEELAEGLRAIVEIAEDRLRK